MTWELRQTYRRSIPTRRPTRSRARSIRAAVHSASTTSSSVPRAGLVELNCNKLEIFLDKPLAPSTHRHLATAWASDHYGLSATFEYTGAKRLG